MVTVAVLDRETGEKRILLKDLNNRQKEIEKKQVSTIIYGDADES